MLGLQSAKLAKASDPLLSPLLLNGSELPNGSVTAPPSPGGLKASLLPPGAGGRGGGAFFCLGGRAGVGEGPGRGGAGLFPREWDLGPSDGAKGSVPKGSACRGTDKYIM